MYELKMNPRITLLVSGRRSPCEDCGEAHGGRGSLRCVIVKALAEEVQKHWRFRVRRDDCRAPRRNVKTGVKPDRLSEARNARRASSSARCLGRTQRRGSQLTSPGPQQSASRDG